MNRRHILPGLAALATVAAVSALEAPAQAQTPPAVVHDVRAHGAVGDGVADDGPALQAALNAARLVGGTVFFPPGKYRIATSVYVDMLNAASNVALVGTGGSSQIIIAAPQAIGIHNADGLVAVRDLVFVGASGGIGDCIVALAIHGAHLALIERCEFYGLACDGVPYWANWGSVVRLYNTPGRIVACSFLGCWARDGVVLVDQVRAVVVEDCRFIDLGALDGVTYSYGGGPSAAWVHLRHVDGESLTATGGNVLRVARCTMDEGAPIRVLVSGPGRVPRVELDGCMMNLGGGGVGVRLAHVDQVRITGGLCGWINAACVGVDLIDCGSSEVRDMRIQPAHPVSVQADASCRYLRVEDCPAMDVQSDATRTVIVEDGEVVS